MPAGAQRSGDGLARVFKGGEELGVVAQSDRIACKRGLASMARVSARRVCEVAAIAEAAFNHVRFVRPAAKGRQSAVV